MVVIKMNIFCNVLASFFYGDSLALLVEYLGVYSLSTKIEVLSSISILWICIVKIIFSRFHESFLMIKNIDLIGFCKPAFRICVGCKTEIGHGRFLSCMGNLIFKLLRKTIS